MRHRFWRWPLAIVPLLVLSLGTAARAIVPVRPPPSRPAASSMDPPTSPSPIPAKSTSSGRVPVGLKGQGCPRCLQRQRRNQSRDRRLESPHVLPPFKNTGRLPAPLALHPHAIDSLFGVGSFISQRGPGLAGPLLARVQLLGADWVREEMTANLLHGGPHQPYRWSTLDGVVNRERAEGLSILGLLDYSDTWTDRNHAMMPHADIDQLSADFAHYAAAVVRHFRGRISAWQVWNEPNLPTFWRPHPNPSDYAHLLAAAYRAIKRVDPRATVVMAGMSGVDLHFLHAVIARTHAFDAIAVHPYRLVPEDQLLRQIAALCRFHRPIWLTEIGWAASDRCPLGTDEETQAGDLVRFYTLAAAAGVRHIFWYDLRDNLHVPANPEGHFGLLRRDLSGKPAFAAFRVLAHLLTGARFIAANALDRSGVYALRFQTQRGTVESLWNTGSTDETISIPWSAQHADLLGFDGHVVASPVPKGDSVAIHLAAASDPVYLVESPLTPVSLPGPLIRRLRTTRLALHRRVPHRTVPVRHVHGRQRIRPARRNEPRLDQRAAHVAPRRPEQQREHPASAVEHGSQVTKTRTPMATSAATATPSLDLPGPTPFPPTPAIATPFVPTPLAPTVPPSTVIDATLTPPPTSSSASSTRSASPTTSP